MFFVVKFYAILIIAYHINYLLLLKLGKKNIPVSCPLTKRIIFDKYFCFENLHVCSNERKKYIHILRNINEDLKFPKVFVLLIHVMYHSEQPAKKKKRYFFYN